MASPDPRNGRMAGFAAATSSCAVPHVIAVSGRVLVGNKFDPDRIYECSFVPDLWPGVLDDLPSFPARAAFLLVSARPGAEMDRVGQFARILPLLCRADVSGVVRTGSACSEYVCRILVSAFLPPTR
jgi:hypothetical protein